MQISQLLQSQTVQRQISTLRNQMTESQVQLATGKKSQTFSGLGSATSQVLNLRSEINTKESYQSTINTVLLRLEAVEATLARTDDITSELRTASLTSGFEFASTDQTQLQLTATERLEELVALMNVDLNGRYLFAGADTQSLPVETYDKILNGTTTLDGFNTIRSERAQADMGADNRGRLSIPVPGGATVTVTEDNAPPFGLKFSAVSSNLTGTTAAISGAPQQLDVTFTASLPTDGQEIEVAFDLPDGTSTTLTLTATTTAPAGEGEFLVGADENATAANFQSAFASAVETLVQTEVRAASAMQAATEFFEYDSSNPPQRVATSPASSATALVDATTTDTVFWYQGDTTTSPVRDSAVAKIDDGRTITYGTGANESPITDTFKALAVLSSMTFSDTSNDELAYKEVTKRTSGLFAFNGATSVSDLRTQLGLKQSTIEAQADRHDTLISASEKLLAEVENADTNEVGAIILQLETQLTATYQATSLVSRLSLVNYI